MRIEQGCLLRIYVGEGDKHAGRPLYEWIVTQAHARQLAGATVYRGLMGFGPHTRVIHTFKIERLAEDLPITIEIIDSRDKVEQFLTFIEQQTTSNLFATMQTIEIRSIQERPR
ncbi:MAG: DUF190 domain-containing protein [Nitrospira sp.]|nr:DUF190 domain-containing protein [Nitrospira sp.]